MTISKSAKSIRLPLIFLLPPLFSLLLIWTYKYFNDDWLNSDFLVGLKPEQPNNNETYATDGQASVDNSRPNWTFLFAKSKQHQKLSWVAITGDSITRNQYFHTIRSLFSNHERTELVNPVPPLPISYKPNDSYFVHESQLTYDRHTHSYATWIDPTFFVGMRRTRLFCCSLSHSGNGTCRYWSVDSYHLNITNQPWSLTNEISQYARSNSPPYACWSWDYRNFPDDDLRESINDYAMFLEESKVELHYIMLNAGLHPLMHNWTHSEFHSQVERTFQVLQQHSHILRNVIWHDTTWVDLKELPPWKKHITNERVDEVNRILEDVIPPYKDVIRLLSVNAVSRRAKNFVNLSDVATTGDGMHYNGAFNDEVMNMDWSTFNR